MKIFLQIDPPEVFNPKTDSTMSLALEAQKRGHKLFYYLPEDLSNDRGEVCATVRPIVFYPREVDYFEVGEPRRASLEKEANVVLIRQDPPYDMAYLTTTWLLEGLKKPKVLNKPKALREHPEKLFPLQFPQFCPPTLISANMDDLQAFQREVGVCVLKPLYGHGGHGVLKIPATGENLDALLEMLLIQSPEPVILQQYLPFVEQEEKRILLINGEFAGVFGRIPAENEIRTNMRVGGKPIPTTLTTKQHEICKAVGAVCKKEGLMLVGLDVIGDWLTEVNITSPTGLRAVEDLYGENPAAMFWDAVEG